jgi:diguanylate cyclase (GGDEF)-like protein
VTNDLKILFVDDEPSDILFEQRELERHGLSFASRIAANETEAIHHLAVFKPDVVLCDYSMPGFSGPQALDTVRRIRPATPILMVSGSIPDDTAIELLSRGATDYVLKSNLRRLGPAVRRAVAETRQRAALEARIDELAHYDALTGLPNLAHVDLVVERCFEHARNKRALAALVVLNLDQFRYIDEFFGRSAADQALKDIATILKSRSRRFDFVARIGPNEFLLVLSAFDNTRDAGLAVRRLLLEVSEPRALGKREVVISASAGIALYPLDGLHFADLRCKATAALHEAKAVARGGLQFHMDDAVQHAQHRRRLETELRDAVQREQLTLHYQPQFDIPSGEVCGVEALARWFPAGGVTIAPSVFIPLAEQTGLIGALGTWALRTGCRTAAEWHEHGVPTPTVSVNVSPQQICEGFTAEIAEALDRSGLKGPQLELEITESILVTNIDLAMRCLHQWRNLGVHIALDDFGTGYSSLGYLSKLPIDRLKIDGSLIRGMTTGSKDTTIVRTVISLGRELGFTVLAEGVETEEQLSILSGLGCQQAQGYLLTAPTAAPEARSIMGRPWGSRGAAPIHRGVYQ